MADTFTITERTVIEKSHTYERKPGGWQLPCGCEGPDLFICEEEGQAHCAHCKRGWWMMGRKSSDYCVMLDGQPQGPRVVIANPMATIEEPEGTELNIYKRDDGRFVADRTGADGTVTRPQNNMTAEECIRYLSHLANGLAHKAK